MSAASISESSLESYRGKQKTLWQRIWKERFTYLIISPVFISYIIFFFYPIGFAFVTSFTRFDAFTIEPLPNILDNYHRAIIRDQMARKSLINVIKYVILTLGAGQTFALILALSLNSLKKGVGFFRTLYYFPMITSVVTVATIFRWLFGSDPSAPINAVLKALFGLESTRWLWEASLVIPIISLIAIWCGLGFNTIIWMAGLKAIPPEYYEVARIDGASSWRQFWSITLPLLRPVMLFQLVMGFIGGMKEFGLPYVMTQGGPAGASLTPVLLVYQNGFENLQMGYASALAFLLAFLLIIASLIQFKIYGKSEAYD